MKNKTRSCLGPAFWLCLPLVLISCSGISKPEKPDTIYAMIIRAGAAQNDPTILDKDEFMSLLDRVSEEEANRIEMITLGTDVANDKTSWMDAFRTRYFNGYDLSQLLSKLLLEPLEKSGIRLVGEYTSDALKKNLFSFVPGSSVDEFANRDIFTDKMVDVSGYLYLCLGYNQDDPGIRGIKTIRLPKPSKTVDGLMYIPGSALHGKQCIVYVPKTWFGAGSQHKGFYPHDYSVTLNMLLELAELGDTEFAEPISGSFGNFKSLAESIGHIPNANKSWSIGSTSRTQTNTLVSQVFLYAKYLKKTKGEKYALKWLKDIGLPIAQNNLAFLTAERAKTPQGLFRFVPIGRTPDDPAGDTYVYTSEMHGSPVLHNFYFERILSDFIRTLETMKEEPNYCTTTDCLKYIEEVSDAEIIAKLKPRDLERLIEQRKGYQALSDEDVAKRMEFARQMEGQIFVWDNPIRGEELIVKSSKTGKYYRLTNYALGSDQAMRASGFDPSDVAGLNSLEAMDTAYAGHNAQLYRQMNDMARIYIWLGMKDMAHHMEEEASRLKRAILGNMWSPTHGELVAFHQKKGRTNYRFFDMSYALWAHLFDTSNLIERARLMSTVRNISDYEGPEGPYASTDWSGHNWGWGKVWPVMAAYAFMGLRDYGKELQQLGLAEEAKLLDDTAQRIALKWLYANAEMFAKEFGFGENLAVREDGKPLENVYGYNVDPKKAGNYTWHIAITRWLYSQLNPKSRRLFDSFYSILKSSYPNRL